MSASHQESRSDVRIDLQHALEVIEIVGYALARLEAKEWNQGTAWMLPGALHRITDRMCAHLDTLSTWALKQGDSTEGAA